MLDLIIVGQGLAGTLLSWFLIKNNQKVLVADHFRTSSASRVASGISNPITGRRFVKTWMADVLFPFAEKTYRDIEQQFDVIFFEPVRIFKLLDSVKAQNDWSARCAQPEYLPYLKNDQLIHLNSSWIQNEFGAFEISGATKLDTVKFLDVCRDFLKSNNYLSEELFSFNDLTISEDSITWKGLKASKIIFCEGVAAMDNPYFKFLPFQPAKGERLKVKIEDFYPDRVINGEVFIVPESGSGEYYVGATHDWHFDDDQPSEKGLNELNANLRSFLKSPYELIGHESAIRPTVQDRRPFIGFHPEFPRVGIFNGMGTKGVSLSPFFADHFSKHILNGTPLMPEVDINRFL